MSAKKVFFIGNGFSLIFMRAHTWQNFNISDRNLYENPIQEIVLHFISIEKKKCVIPNVCPNYNKFCEMKFN